MSDYISRQAAIDALDVLCQEHRYKIPGKGETYSQYNEAWQDALDRAEGAIFNLPPAQPEKRTGERTETHACDSISRQAAIDEAKEWIDAVYFEENDKRERKAIECFIGSLKNMPSAQPEPQWIPCSERLPEGGRVVLVTEKGGFIRHCEYANYCDFQEFQTVEEGLTVHDVIAWMPLPEPYKGEES